MFDCCGFWNTLTLMLWMEMIDIYFKIKTFKYFKNRFCFKERITIAFSSAIKGAPHWFPIFVLFIWEPRSICLRFWKVKPWEVARANIGKIPILYYNMGYIVSFIIYITITDYLPYTSHRVQQWCSCQSYRLSTQTVRFRWGNKQFPQYH